MNGRYSQMQLSKRSIRVTQPALYVVRRWSQQRNFFVRTSSTPGASSQGTVGNLAGRENVSPHQARLQAAAAAAAIYKKSYVYPSPNAISWSFGYPGQTVVANNDGDGLSLQHPNMTFSQLLQWAGTLPIELIEHQIDLISSNHPIVFV
ncbi:hypothetical protein CASFOL_020762 [Castilleja foliolosa]|uniref:Uncharacterized protein n=1 Tax=Castilleja foliolosa TaxID=1961234 RepID=A0ABD3D1S1_9LAMI